MPESITMVLEMERVDTTDCPVQKVETLATKLLMPDIVWLDLYLFLFLVEKHFLFLFQMRTVGERGTLLWSISHGWEGVVTVSMELLRNIQVRVKKAPAV